MEKRRRMKNIFADKATLVLRKMISVPDKKWVIRDFVGKDFLSLGMAQEVLFALEKQGYVERVKKGPDSFTVFTNKDRLIEDWVKKYQFSFNDVHTYYTPDKDIHKKIKNYFRDERYAFTLHTGANLITSYVRTEDVYFYVTNDFSAKNVVDLRQKLDLKQLVQGGNIYIIRPYYKHSVFFNTQLIKGYRTVSDLQLYLDLYNFQPRGREHAEYLKRLLKEKGRELA